MKLIKKYTIFTFAIENSWLRENQLMNVGWGNGYVAIGPDHPFYRKEDDVADLDMDIEITYSNLIPVVWAETYKIPKNYWVIGFDTCHSYDSLEKWPNEQSVLDKANEIKNTLLQINPK